MTSTNSIYEKDRPEILAGLFLGFEVLSFSVQKNSAYKGAFLILERTQSLMLV